MIWIFLLFIILLSVGTVAYPLFLERIQKYKPTSSHQKSNLKGKFWLSALSDLEDDCKLGRISQIDYKKQKNFLQRNYLDSIKDKN